MARDLDLQLKIDAAINGLRELRSAADTMDRFGEEAKQADTGLKALSKNAQKFGTSMQSVGRSLSKNVTLPLAGLAGLSLANFVKQEKAIANVTAGLRATGNAAGKTIEELQGLASGLQSISTFGDEDILNDVTAQLLTFKNVTGDTFDRTQEAVLDLAATMGTDLKSASIQVGKALNDPTTGLTALSRVGITFTETQTKMIKSLQETNQLSEAQAIILKELESQFGGTAAALADVDPYTQLRNALGDVSEEFGRVVNDNLRPFILRAKELAERFQALDQSTKTFVVNIGLLVAALGPALIAMGSFVRLAGFSLLPFVSGIKKLAGAYALLDIAITKSIAKFGLFRTALISTGIGAIVVGIGILIAKFTELAAEVGSFSTAFKIVQQSAIGGLANLNLIFNQGLLKIQNIWVGFVNSIIELYNDIPFLDDVALGTAATFTAAEKQINKAKETIAATTFEIARLKAEAGKVKIDDLLPTNSSSLSDGVVELTPALPPPAVIEEKVRGTLELVKTTAERITASDLNSIDILSLILTNTDGTQGVSDDFESGIQRRIEQITSNIQGAAEIATSVIADEGSLTNTLITIGEQGVSQLEALRAKLLEVAQAASAEQLPAIREFVTEIDAAIQETTESTNTLKTQLTDIAEQAKTSFTDGLVNGLTDFATGADDASQSFKEFAASFLKNIQRMILKALILEAIQRSLAAFGIGASTGGFIGVQAATGGHITGRGTATSDSIPAWLSNGEFVLRTAAVRAAGTDALHALNRMDFPAAMELLNTRTSKNKNAVNGNRFNQGGLVGGASVGDVTINLQNNGTPQQTVGTDVQFDGKDLIVNVITDDLNNNGRIAQSIGNTFAAKRRGSAG